MRKLASIENIRVSLNRYYEKGPVEDGLNEGEKLKGQIVLRGATISIHKLTRIEIKLAADKTKTVTSVSLRASSAQDVRIVVSTPY